MNQIRSISAEQLLERMNEAHFLPEQIIDVREPQEWDYYHIEATRLIPMNTIPHRLGELEDDKPIYIVCAHGVRSLAVCRYLQEQGYGNLFNVEGGMAAIALLQGFQYD
ncbi:rhodanese-like domain-containing protein [Paenibacillus sp. NEAU-GSW1]|uniref:rhodanese-like domain-containing protein n=1 Tax=Paenibacillus sp. NEAU-GSW1 TaxID=2682486 RepID=UPI0012E2DFDF|nr:rhodanese-like domain-containing protein [Paenibacillus sp. NEAU-GSW1]MUT65516.1 rhodanese-like domain-containing protein [Paenibacillus sp. NEAU-GSW1]